MAAHFRIPISPSPTVKIARNATRILTSCDELKSACQSIARRLEPKPNRSKDITSKPNALNEFAFMVAYTTREQKRCKLSLQTSEPGFVIRVTCFEPRFEVDWWRRTLSDDLIEVA